ncbi:hypothetical protein [Lacrimispora xylanisolvens]|uniref:hypothetical protein n=1 Tax=Lacrimispora xylanisolvens TaxID=384636 RepID=UPI002402C5AE
MVKLKEAKRNLRNVFLIPEDELCFQESDVILGIRYLVDEAKKMERPLVICIAMGTSQGIHDGQGVMSQYLANLLLLSGVDVSIAAGDEGNRGRHYFGTIDSPPYSTEFQLNIGNDDKKLAMEIWPNIPGRPAIQIISPDRMMTYKIEPSFNECIKFAFGQGLVWVNNIVFEEETGLQLILIRFDQAEPGIWTFRLDSTEDQPFLF